MYISSLKMTYCSKCVYYMGMECLEQQLLPLGTKWSSTNTTIWLLWLFMQCHYFVFGILDGVLCLTKRLFQNLREGLETWTPALVSWSFSYIHMLSIWHGLLFMSLSTSLSKIRKLKRRGMIIATYCTWTQNGTGWCCTNLARVNGLQSSHSFSTT